jgi:hypothetical protein
MALSHVFHPSAGNNDIGVGDFSFTFTTNGTGAIAQTFNGLYVASVTRTNVGTYQVTLTDAFYQINGIYADVVENPTGSPRCLSASVQVPDSTANPLVFDVFTFPPGSATPTDYGPGAASTTPATVCVLIKFRLSVGA